MVEPGFTMRSFLRNKQRKDTALRDMELRSQGHHEARGGEWIEIGARKWVMRSKGWSITTERPVLKARSPVAKRALIDKATSDLRGATFVCEDTVAEGGVERISSC